MSVLVYIENWDGQLKKGSYEAVQYAAQTAKMMGTEAIGISLGKVTSGLEECGKYGINKVISVANGMDEFNNYNYADAIAQVASENNASTVVISSTFNGKSIAPILAVKQSSSLITNVCELPSSTSPLTVKRSVFSSKGFVEYSSSSDKSIIAFIPNSIGLEAGDGSASVEEKSLNVGDSPAIHVDSVDRAQGKIPLPEAELVVSGGRGLKAADNWGIIEDLADTLNAGTACSKPVSDMGWRPHSEHVGQTGIAINPNLYIAVGISGAIQHLAGVSSSKTIVVVNTDSEAPFFKAADYGIVGDAFDVIPKLTAAIKDFKAAN